MSSKPTFNNTFGYQPDGTWHFGDCTISSDGEVDAAFPLRKLEGVPTPKLLIPKPKNVDARHPALVFSLFGGYLEKSIGFQEARDLLGMACAYVAAPYLLMNNCSHPGIWLHGPRATGKSLTARWLRAIYGLGEKDHAIGLGNGTTYLGLAKSLQQYCCLPVVLDEYRPNRIAGDKEAVIRSACDRSAVFIPTPKASLVSLRHEPLTSPIVCGEGVSFDAATRSRYFHFDFTKVHRLGGDDVSEINNVLARQLHMIGLTLLKNHATFGGAVVDALRASDALTRQDGNRALYLTTLAQVSYEQAVKVLTK